jgi:hypothetical protein
MNNIVLFRGRTSATKFSAPHVFSVETTIRSASSMRPRLIAIWHTNPDTGKLECFWTTEREPVLDEDGSRRAA